MTLTHLNFSSLLTKPILSTCRVLPTVLMETPWEFQLHVAGENIMKFE